MDQKSSNSIKELMNELYGEDFLVRCDAVEELSFFIEEEQVLKAIIEMLNDRNYLVRCEACDALINTKSIEVLNILIFHLKKEKSSIARMYTISTICNLMKQVVYTEEVVIQLNALYSKEKSKRVLIAYLSLFYLIEKERKYIEDALEYINDEDYHIRINVINLLSEVIDNNIIDVVYNAYKNRYLIENAESVKILLLKEIGYLEQIRAEQM